MIWGLLILIVLMVISMTTLSYLFAAIYVAFNLAVAAFFAYLCIYMRQQNGYAVGPGTIAMALFLFAVMLLPSIARCLL